MKFGSTDVPIEPILQSYLEGLFWILTYYHFGCASWSWFYPYLYAPLASDFQHLNAHKISFVKSRPFSPLLQLVSVLPPQSFNLLPQKYANLVMEKNSPLLRFFPTDFPIDLNGKKFAWESVVQLPFIHEETLISTICKINHQSDLSNVERARNFPGHNHHFRLKSGQTTTTTTRNSKKRKK